MPKLTRRRFLAGAPAVVAVAVVGVAVARTGPPTFPVITSDDSAQRMYLYHRAAYAEHIKIAPKAPFVVYPKDIKNITPLI